jgi:cbb3-type cytochrome oxidase subunit 3
MGCGRCTSLTLVLVSSIIFTAIGAAITVLAAMALALPWAREIVPNWYSGVTLAVGIVILLFALFGYLSLCKKEKKCTLGVFMIFTIIITALSVASAVFLFRTEEALRYANNVNFVNITDWELSAAQELRGGIERTFEACEATVTETVGQPGEYELQCANPELDEIQDAVNSQCLQEESSDVGDRYYDCFVSTWWPQPEGVDPNDVEAVLNTPKGLFCACYQEFNEEIEYYFVIGKWVSVAVSVFFFLVFIACCYLCCCSVSPQQRQQKEQQKAANTYLARP